MSASLHLSARRAVRVLVLGAYLGCVSCAKEQQGSLSNLPNGGAGPNATISSQAASERLLEALVAEAKLGDIRTVSIYDLGNKTTRTVRRWVKLIDGFPCERAETTLSGPLAPTKTFITLATRDGTWELFPDAAVRMVDVAAAMRGELAQSTAAGLLQASRFTAEPQTLRGKNYVRVTAFFSDETRFSLASQMSKSMKDEKVTVAMALASIPQRREYLIDESLGIVTSLRQINAAGGVIQETHFDEIEGHLDLPLALFAIPEGVRRYYPQTTTEFRSLSTDAYVRSQSLSPSTVLGQNTPSNNPTKNHETK